MPRGLDLASLPASLDSLNKLRQLRSAVAKTVTPVNSWVQYRDDPINFVERGLGERIWSKQREICEAVRDYPRVAVASCHESGKSFIAARIVCWWISVWPPGEAFVVTSAPTFKQVRAILWREIKRAHSRGKLPGHTNMTEWIIGPELVAFGSKPDDAAPDAFQGLHARHLLVLFDEACGMPASLWTAAETLVANEGGRIFVIGNPDDPQTEFGNVCLPGSGYKVIHISAFDTPNMTNEDVPDDVKVRLIGRDWVDERKRRWGESSPLYISKVLGRFPDVSADSLISPRWVTDAVNRDLPAEGPNEIGVDVARSLDRNETVIYHRHGRRARLHTAVRIRDLMQVTGLVVQAVRDTGAKKIKIDDVGLGGGVTDRLIELKSEPGHVMADVDVVPVNVGLPPSGDEEKQRFFNQRSEFCWGLRDRFYDNDIDLGDDEDTQAQICIIKYKPNSRGQVVVESKEDIEKRLANIDSTGTASRSPDRFDALMLAFAEPVPAAFTSLWSAADLVAA